MDRYICLSILQIYAGILAQALLEFQLITANDLHVSRYNWSAVLGCDTVAHLTASHPICDITTIYSILQPCTRYHPTIRRPSSLQQEQRMPTVPSLEKTLMGSDIQRPAVTFWEHSASQTAPYWKNHPGLCSFSLYEDLIWFPCLEWCSCCEERHLWPKSLLPKTRQLISKSHYLAIIGLCNFLQYKLCSKVGCLAAYIMRLRSSGHRTPWVTWEQRVAYCTYI